MAVFAPVCQPISTLGQRDEMPATLCVTKSVLMILATSQGFAQNGSPPANFGAAQVLPLYTSVVAGSEKWDYSEIVLEGKSGPQVKNVVKPTLLYFPAAHSAGTAMIVAPGGGNRTLMMSYEGVDIAKKLNEAGVDAFVLKYRLIYTGPEADTKEPATTGPQAGQNVRELSGLDGRRSVELLRERAVEFNIDPNRIGMIGFSAGGGPIRAAMDGPSAICSTSQFSCADLCRQRRWCRNCSRRCPTPVPRRLGR